ncbi:MAG: flavodoxin [Bacteroidales bacterium]|nr:flavodoxin [Bacteroidales bacterium]
MKKTGLFYGTTSGSTKKVAELIKKEMGADSVDIYDIKNTKPEDILQYENLIFGTSAWGIGDMQDDWELLIDDIVDLDFTGKKIALFGLGDQENYPGSFADGMGTIYCRLPVKDQIVGFTSTRGYKYYFSSAEKDGKFVGLAIDHDSQADKTPERVKKWAAQLKKEFN